MSRVVIIDDHRAFGERLQAFIREQEGCVCVGLGTDASVGFKLVGATHVDVVIIDIGLPDENAFRLAERLLGRYPDIRVVLMGDNEAAEYTRAAALAGAIAYVPKTDVSQRLPALLGAARPSEANGRDRSGVPQRRSVVGNGRASSDVIVGSGTTLAMIATVSPLLAANAAVSLVAVVGGVAIDQPAVAIAGVIGFLLLSHRQTALSRNLCGHAGQSLLQRVRSIR